MSHYSGVGIATIKRMESMNGVPAGNIKTLMLFKKAFEEAGVEFIGTPEDSPGVRLTKKVHHS